MIRDYVASADWRRDGMAWAATEKFARRIEQATTALRTAATRGPVMVATSWGKDSVVAADLALRTLGPLPLVHLASAYELPGYEEVIAHFQARAPIVTLEATRTLGETIAWLRQYGLGYERANKAGAKHAKADRVAAWCRETGHRVQVLGLRAEESPARGVSIASRGLVRARRDGMVTALPIARWTGQDVWAYIASRGLPYNRMIYDAETHGYSRYTLRNAGWLTTISAHRGQLVWLRRHFPRQWHQLAVEFPQIRMIS